MPASVVAIDAVGLPPNGDNFLDPATTFRQVTVHPMFRQNGLLVSELTNSHANRSEAVQAIQGPGVVYITGVSHGTSEIFTGTGDVPVFERQDCVPASFKGKIVHLLACGAGASLGKDIVRSGGASAFFGYSGPFTAPVGAGGGFDNLFFDCDAEVDRQLASGATAGTAATETLAVFDKQIAALNKGNAAMKLLGAMLQRDRDLFCSVLRGAEYGDPNARLSVK